MLLSHNLDRQHSSRSGFFLHHFQPLLLVRSVCSLESRGHGASYALSSPRHCVHADIEGQIPIQLAEMSPPAFRATFPGVAYQLGNVCPVFKASRNRLVTIRLL